MEGKNVRNLFVQHLTLYHEVMKKLFWIPTMMMLGKKQSRLREAASQDRQERVLC